MFYQNRSFNPPYNNQQSLFQSPTGLYRPTMDSSTSSQSNQPYSPLNRVNLDMDFEQFMYTQVDDDSPVEEMSPVKAKKPSKRASNAKKNDNKESSKEWTTAEENSLCKGWCDVSENSEKGTAMKTKGFWQAVIITLGTKLVQREGTTRSLANGKIGFAL
ncbi:hypothetical protein Tco_1048107 [Tanacetum coccineum]